MMRSLRTWLPALAAGVVALLAGGPALAAGWSLAELLPEALTHNLEHMVGKTWLEGSEPHVTHVFFALFVLGVGFLLMLRANKRVKAEDVVLPETRWSAFTVFDVLIEWLLGLMERMMPRDKAVAALPVIVAFFVFIFMCNFLGLIPGFLPPTDNLNTTAALGLVAFVVYNYMGIKQQGLVTYAKHFMGPVIWLAPLMIIIEIISHFARPLSLSLRLMGNMFGDHMVLGIFLGFHLLLVPLPVMALGLLVVTVQALVFTLLAIVYIAMAVEEHEHHDDHAGHGEHAHA